MKIKHNKKRNAGLIFEQLNNVLTVAVAQGDAKLKTKCLSIINEHFKAGTELHKELRLFLALNSMQVKNTVLIDRILREAKIAANQCRSDKLSAEKTALIKRINETFGKDFVFDQQVENFKAMATTQVLLNEWRKAQPSPYVHRLEDQLLESIRRDEQKIIVEKQDFTNLNPLVYEIAKKRFAEKYKSLSPKQLSLVFEFTTVPIEKRGVLFQKYDKSRQAVIAAAQQYLREESGRASDFFKEQLKEAIDKLSGFTFLSEAIAPEEKVKRAVTIQKLFEEISHE
jgi:hypothetical protein